MKKKKRLIGMLFLLLAVCLVVPLVPAKGNAVNVQAAGKAKAKKNGLVKKNGG